MLLEHLKTHAEACDDGRTAADVRIGMCYTAVALDDGATGVAYTFRNEIPEGCVCRHGPLAGTSAAELCAGITSEDLVERTVGIATANALINREQDGMLDGDTLDIIQPGPTDVVGMVGYFGPLVPQLKKRVRELRIFERVSRPTNDVYPEEEALSFLPTCSIALITSTTIINRTAEELIESAKNCRISALVGSSTPLARRVFAPCGIRVLSGIIITDGPGIMRIVSEIGGTRYFKGHVRKVNLHCAA